MKRWPDRGELAAHALGGSRPAQARPRPRTHPTIGASSAASASESEHQREREGEGDERARRSRRAVDEPEDSRSEPRPDADRQHQERDRHHDDLQHVEHVDRCPTVTIRTTMVSSTRPEHVVGDRRAEHRARLDAGAARRGR